MVTDINQMTGDMLKALDSSAAADFIKEDLEVEAVNTIYNETDPNELRLLKLLPRTEARAVKHYFTRITEFSGNSGSGFFGESSLPHSSQSRSYKKYVDIKLMGEIARVFQLAALENKNAISILGQQGLEEGQGAMTRNAILQKINRQLYRARTDIANYNGTVPTSNNSLNMRFEGIKQQIIKGTDGTEDPSGQPSAVTHIIDMAGQPLGTANVREGMAQVAELYGMPTCLFLPPLALQNLEDELDPKERIIIPKDANRYFAGVNVAGMNTINGRVWFEVDNGLSPQYYQGQPVKYTNLNVFEQLGVPAKPASVHFNTVAAASHASSKFLSAHAGTYHYKISFVRNEIESEVDDGTHSVAVAAGERVTINLDTDGRDVDLIKIYRTKKDGGATGRFFCIAEYAVTDSLAHDYYDTNSVIAGTTEVFGLNISSTATRSFRSAETYEQGVMGIGGIAPKAVGRNTVSLANLGPFMAIFELGKLLMYAKNDVIYSAITPQVLIPTQNIIWVNVAGGVAAEA
jgi:hypothetical protein